MGQPTLARRGLCTTAETTTHAGHRCGPWLAVFTRHPSPRELAERGLVAPHWPQPWGIGADPTLQLVVDDELRRAGVRRPTNTIGIGWAGPTILHAGTTGQKDRYLTAAAGRRGDLVPAVQRARRRLRPGLVDHPGRSGRRPVGGHGAEGLDVVRARRPLRDPAGPHRAGCPRPSGNLLLHLPDGRPGSDRPTARRHDRDPHLQRGLSRRGAAAGRQPGRCPRPGLVVWPR